VVVDVVQVVEHGEQAARIAATQPPKRPAKADNEVSGVTIDHGKFNFR
jgi:hypothetical protein